MNEEEKINHWLNYLHNRLNRFENYFNYMISTLLVMVGLIGSLVVSFSTGSFYAMLSGSIAVSLGIIILWISIRRLLSIQIKKKNATGELIEKIISNEIQASKEIKNEWESIKKI